MKSIERTFLRNLLMVIAVCGTVGLAGFSWTYLPAADDAKSDEPLTLMRKKLDDSSKILEGLTLNDADMIKKATERLLKVTAPEMWRSITDKDYFEFNSEFRSTLHKLEKAASDKNFDKALLEWFDATKGCIECHKYVRDASIKLKSK